MTELFEVIGWPATCCTFRTAARGGRRAEAKSYKGVTGQQQQYITTFCGSRHQCEMTDMGSRQKQRNWHQSTSLKRTPLA